MTQPSGDELPDSEPAGTAKVSSFGQVSELQAEFSPTGGGKFSLKGAGTPGYLVGLVVLPLLCLFGVVGAVVLLLADKPFWQAAVVFGVCLAIGLVCSTVAKRSRSN